MNGWEIAALGMIAGWLGLLSKWLSWSVKSAIDNQLSAFRVSLTAEFGSKFEDSRLAEAKLMPIQKEIARIDRHLEEVDNYSHSANHDLREEIMNVKSDLAMHRINHGLIKPNEV